jgi:hypothetical protein
MRSRHRLARPIMKCGDVRLPEYLRRGAFCVEQMGCLTIVGARLIRWWREHRRHILDFRVASHHARLYITAEQPWLKEISSITLANKAKLESRRVFFCSFSYVFFSVNSDIRFRNFAPVRDGYVSRSYWATKPLK